MVRQACAAVLCLLCGIATCARGTAPGPGGSAPTSPPTPEPAVSAVAGAGAGAGPAAQRADFHCFSWVHGPEFSTDCFRSAAICERERIDMKEGARDTTECSKVKGASCTRASRPPAPGDNERCFGDANNCERYRAYVQGNGLSVTPCEDL